MQMVGLGISEPEVSIPRNYPFCKIRNPMKKPSAEICTNATMELPTQSI